MKRRRFLELLGAAPIAAKTITTVEPEPTSVVESAPTPDDGPGWHEWDGEKWSRIPEWTSYPPIFHEVDRLEDLERLRLTARAGSTAYVRETGESFILDDPRQRQWHD